MDAATFDMERSIARCRVFLAVSGIVTWYVDPSTPMLTRWAPITGGSFVLDAYWVTVLLTYLAYGLAVVAVDRDLEAVATQHLGRRRGERGPGRDGPVAQPELREPSH